MLELKPSLCPRDRTRWRTWLEKNHRSRSEVWLVLYKRHTGRPTVSENDAVEEALCFGWIDGLRRSLDAERYAKRFTPRRPESLWSALNKSRIKRMIQAGRMTAPGMAAIAAARKSGKWNQRPEEERDPKMPPELGAAIARNRKAAEFFESLAPSYRKRFVRWVANAKREETRHRRVREAVALLARREKLGMK